jgi:hypothetical protein
VSDGASGVVPIGLLVGTFRDVADQAGTNGGFMQSKPETALRHGARCNSIQHCTLLSTYF